MRLPIGLEAITTLLRIRRLAGLAPALPTYALEDVARILVEKSSPSLANAVAKPC